MAIANASEESLFFGLQPGSKILTMVSTCCFSAFPTPTTAFFTLFGSYSTTGISFSAGAKITTPRAMLSFIVETGLSLRKICSMAASSGL